MGKVYPKPPKPAPNLSRRWLVRGENLVGEAGYCFNTEASFRTRLMARVWAWYLWQLASYGGGTITIHDHRENS